FRELGFSHARKRHPSPALIHREQAATPLPPMVCTADFPQVDDLVHLMSIHVGDYQAPINGSEINSTAAHPPIARGLCGDIDTLLGSACLRVDFNNQSFFVQVPRVFFFEPKFLLSGSPHIKLVHRTSSPC